MQIRIETANLTKNLYIILIVLGFLTLPSCSYTKLVPDGQSLLWKNAIYVDGKQGAPSAAEDIIKQKPNKQFLLSGLRPELGLYNWGNGNDSNLFSKLGDAPVIIDTNRVARGALQLQDWYFNKGYFNATSSYNIDSVGKQKAKANYYVIPRERYKISKLNVETQTQGLNSVIAQVFKEDSLVKNGDYYDADKLESLRSKIAQKARNAGFYGFSKNYIRYKADTFLVGNFVNIQMVIDQANVEIDDSTYSQDHKRYFIKDIYVRPDYSYGNRVPPQDTLTADGYIFTYDSLRYNTRYISDAIHLEVGDRYQEEQVKNTYAHLVSYKGFQLTDIDFKPLPSVTDSLGHVGLRATVNLTPLAKRSINLEPELTTSGGSNWGINGNVGWTNRNLFKGGEALQVKLNAGFEIQANPGAADNKSIAFELGGEVAIEYPRFILPFDTQGLLPKRMQPTSRTAISYSILQRREFQRQTFGTRLTYNWKESARKSHKLDLLDITYSRVTSVLPEFEQQLTDIQRQAFTSEFITATRYSYTLNENLITRRKNPRYFKGTFELAGNIMNLLDKAGVGQTSESNGATTVFNVQYFQYAKMEVDGRYHWNIKEKQSWVNRIYSGYILPYGNSSIETDTGMARVPPFSKYFYMGGSNDMRAWTAYRLGAGTEYNTNYSAGTDTTFATGTFKLLYQSEYRFPIVSYLQGALFVDAGNIWLTGGLQNEQTDLKLEDFYKQIAVGGGVGFRLDFDFFVIRFDIGMKLRDPGLLGTGDEWVFLSQPAFVKNWTYNFALGYPF